VVAALVGCPGRELSLPDHGPNTCPVVAWEVASQEAAHTEQEEVERSGVALEQVEAGPTLAGSRVYI